MTTPTTRQEFVEYCLRKLGKPVIKINIDEDQIDDRVDEALRYYWDYHFDGSEKVYYKHQITANNLSKSLYNLTVANGGVGYANTDTLAFDIHGAGANVSITTNANGTIVSANMFDNGVGFFSIPNVSIITSGGTGGRITAEVGGWIPMPQNIIGAVRVFSFTSGANSRNMFDIRYQIALNDLYTLTNQSMVPYFMNMQQLQFYEQLLVGEIPIRYNRHRNRLHLDMGWDKVVPGEWIVVEAYQMLDPDIFTDVWNDRWLQNYATTLMKIQWGGNLSKFPNLQILGGMTFNGEKILNDAMRDKRDMEEDMINSYSIPSGFMIG